MAHTLLTPTEGDPAEREPAGAVLLAVRILVK